MLCGGWGREGGGGVVVVAVAVVAVVHAPARSWPDTSRGGAPLTASFGGGGGTRR